MSSSMEFFTTCPIPTATCREVERVLKPHGVYFGRENSQFAFRVVFDLLQKLRSLWHEEAGPKALIFGPSSY